MSLIIKTKTQSNMYKDAVYYGGCGAGGLFVILMLGVFLWCCIRIRSGRSNKGRVVKPPCVTEMINAADVKVVVSPMSQSQNEDLSDVDT